MAIYMSMVITDDIIHWHLSIDTQRFLHINCSLQNFGFLYKTEHNKKNYFVFFRVPIRCFLRPCYYNMEIK